MQRVKPKWKTKFDIQYSETHIHTVWMRIIFFLFFGFQNSILTNNIEYLNNISIHFVPTTTTITHTLTLYRYIEMMMIGKKKQRKSSLLLASIDQGYTDSHTNTRRKNFFFLVQFYRFFMFTFKYDRCHWIIVILDRFKKKKKN